MGNGFLFYCRLTLSLLVFLFLLSFSLRTAHGEAFANPVGPRPEIGKKGKLPREKLQRIREAAKVLERYRERLMENVEIVGTATGMGADGEAEIRVFTARAGISAIPRSLEGFPVTEKITGRFYALDCPSGPTGRCDRPVPIGVSTGHPSISAGTIGARVTRDINDDGIPEGIYALSNNHVYAAINSGYIGDSVIQPGTFDGGTVQNDFIGTLSAYEAIKFCTVWWFWLICNETNTIDAAIVDVIDPDTGEVLVDSSTPPDGYGSPNSVLHPAFGDPDVINDLDENLVQLLDAPVQKYGRTTGLTYGTVNSINATIDVCYDDLCYQVARFEDQIIITPGSFSGGGDSGSLIVTNDSNKYPVGLLFAGSATDTVANRIDRALIAFDVDIDSGPTPILESITVDPASGTVLEGQTQQFTATGFYDDGSTADLTQTATWQSSDIAIATIDAAGLATGVSEGMVLITATQGGITSNEAMLDVFPAPSPTLESIIVDPANATVEVDHTQQFTAQGNYSDGSTADLTQTATWQSSDIAIATIDAAGLATGVSEGAAQITATQDGIPSNAATLQVTATTYAGPYLQIGKVYVYSDTWTTVTLDRDYREMVVVCTPNYDDDLVGGTTMPVVPLVRNALGSSFEVKLGQAVGGAIEISEAWVHYMVVEAGVYDLPGVKMEADTFVSTVTDYNRSWVGQSRSYAQTYTNPVVVGQVLTYSSGLWTVFWCRGSNKNNPPSASSLWVGKHKGEDPRARLNERIGYIVIEAGAGSIDGIRYEADLGPDNIKGVVNSPPYSYPLSGLSFTPSTGIVIQAAMDGGNGSWALLYGNDPQDALYSDRVYLAVDEDQAWDSERSHTHEQVGYILFE
ncbi:MAG: Ig-like domain-containing protein [Desulfobacteraceae bacterium]